MDPLAKLQWRCRRGTLELDKILSRYLHCCYALSSTAERQLFHELLEYQDHDLQAYLFGEGLPVSKDLARLVDKIRHLPTA